MCGFGKPPEPLDPAACWGTGSLPGAAGLLLTPFCLEKCSQNWGRLPAHLHMASCHLVGDRSACAVGVVAFAEREAAVPGHVCPLNCTLGFCSFRKKQILKCFGSGVASALTHLKNKHTNQNTFKARGRQA